MNVVVLSKDLKMKRISLIWICGLIQVCDSPSAVRLADLDFSKLAWRVVRESWIFVVKLLRVYGGCLGIRRRRRAWKSAISLG